MARTNNLTDFLTDISTAIKQKTGDNTPIPAANFDNKIASIQTGGTYQEKIFNINQNGNYILNPDTGYDAMSKVNIGVNVSGYELPNGIFIQSNVPVTEVNNYFWIKEEDLGDIKISDYIPKSIAITNNKTFGDLLNLMTQEEIDTFDSYSYHYIFQANDSNGRIIATNVMAEGYVSGNYRGLSYTNAYSVGLDSSSSIWVAENQTANVLPSSGANYGIKWADTDIYLNGSLYREADEIDIPTEDGIYFDDPDTQTRYILYKGSQNISAKLLDTTNANAVANNILLNKTAFVNNQQLIGTMPNNGTLNYTPSDNSQNIPAGYTSGGTIGAVTSSIDSNIRAENIKNGVTILGVEGTLESIVEEVIEIQNAYVNGTTLILEEVEENA